MEIRYPKPVVLLFFLFAQTVFFSGKVEGETVALDPNLKCVDLTGLTASVPLDVVRSTQILWRTEAWEHSTWDTEKDHDSVGYPSVVRNDRGPKADGRFYLFYAHHDPNSGIGCAIAESITGPYRKLSDIDSSRTDSQVLDNPGRPKQPFHYSSPCVVWCEEESLWFMYFHYYKNDWKDGSGHQKTALATCPDLAKNVWTKWTDENGDIINVIPVTKERWMNSQSTYHAIQRLPDGQWLAFLRGTGGEYDENEKWVQDSTKLGFAISSDGRNWEFLPDNPVIHAEDGSGGSKGTYRPHFMGLLDSGEYFLCWSEHRPGHADPTIAYGTTRDFKTFTRDPRGYAKWPGADGLISPWREGDHLYLFAGKFVHTMNLRK